MSKSLRKIVYWGSGLSVYALLIAAVFGLLLEADTGHPFRVGDEPSAVSAGQESVQSLLNAVEGAERFSRVLLPLGPDDVRLPGHPAIWKAYLQAGAVASSQQAADAFDGLQAVENVLELSQGSVAELFLSGEPRQVFRRGNFLIVLTGQAFVKIIDCSNPREPQMFGSLRYRQVEHMEMQGDTAYLLIKESNIQIDQLVVVDLQNLQNPQELTRFHLPENTKYFYLLDRQLVVYASSGGYKGKQFIHLYDLTDNLQLASRGSTESPVIGGGFLKYDDYLLISDLRAGLHLCDFRNPQKPAILASLALPDQIKDLARHGDTVFAQGTRNRMYVIDLHDPVHPVLSTVVEKANHTAALLEYKGYSYYFTWNGYLRVFDVGPFDSLVQGERGAGGIAGELVALQAGAGLALLGDSQEPLPGMVTEAFPLPDKIIVVDTLVWQGHLVVLDQKGLVHFFRKGQKTALIFKESLQLPIAQRWLAAGNDRLYVGGKSTVNVVANNDDGHFFLSGQLEVPGQESWDGLVVQQTLCIAAGKEGLLFYSLDSPDHPRSNREGMIPPQLENLIDVRTLVSYGDNRVFAAAGPVGLLSGWIDQDRQFHLDGVFRFRTPVYTIAVVNTFCLVSTGTGIAVVKISVGHALQNIGKIAFPRVERFAVAASGVWAGYVPDVGWTVLPPPQIVLPGESDLLHVVSGALPTEKPQDFYRLNLFNDHEVVTVPGILSMPSLLDGQAAGATHDAR